MAPPDQMTEEERRGLHALAFAGQFAAIGHWLSKGLARERLGDDLQGLIRTELASIGVPEPTAAALIAAHVEPLSDAGRPTSAGR